MDAKNKKSIRDPLFENKLAALLLVAALIAMSPPILYVKLVDRGDRDVHKKIAAPLDKQPELSIVELLDEADARAGANAAAMCKSCHSMVKDGGNMIGPKLWNVYQRDIASLPDFNYSAGIAKHQGKRWNAQELNSFLGDPAGYAPGSFMTIGVRQPEKRADIIAYLMTLSD